jgi:hypothetical protein
VSSTAAAYVGSTAAAHVYGTELKRARMIASAASFTAAYAQRMQQMQLQQQMQMHLMIMHQKQMGAHHERYRGGYVSAELKEDDRKASPFVMRLLGHLWPMCGCRCNCFATRSLGKKTYATQL